MIERALVPIDKIRSVNVTFTESLQVCCCQYVDQKSVRGRNGHALIL